MQDKKPKNAYGQRHGLWEIYYPNGQLGYKGLFIKGIRFGRHEAYRNDGKIQYIDNHINDEYHGYTEFNFGDGRKSKEYYAK